MRQQKRAIVSLIFPIFLVMVFCYGPNLFSQEMEPDTIGIGKKKFAPGEDIRIDYRCSEANLPYLWIGLFKADLDDQMMRGAGLSIKLLGELKSSILLNAPKTPGNYQVRLFSMQSGNVSVFHRLNIEVKEKGHTNELPVTDNAGNKQGIRSRFYSVSNDNSGRNLTEDLIEYTGEFGKPCIVSFMRNGEHYEAEAFPGQVVVFFKDSQTVETAHNLIKSKGGHILGQVPALDYYFVGVDAGLESSFIDDITADSRIWIAIPHLAGNLDGDDVIVVDHFGGDPHGPGVIAALEACGGSAASFSADISTSIFTEIPGKGRTKYMLNGDKFISELGKYKNQPLLINLSSSAGADPCDDWAGKDADGKDKYSAEQKKTYQKTWKTGMLGQLAMMAKLIKNDPKLSNNLVITFSAGNSNMNIADMLKELRSDPVPKGHEEFKDILEKNVLIVTTSQKICDKTIHANGQEGGDPALAITDNKEAAGGSSFAAPCAMAYLQQVGGLNGFTPVQALKAVKAVMAKNNGKVDIVSLGGLLGTDGTYTGTYKASFYNEGFSCTPKGNGAITIKLKEGKLSYTMEDYPFQYRTDNCDVKKKGRIGREDLELKASGWYVSADFSSGGVARNLGFTLRNNSITDGGMAFRGTTPGGLKQEVVITFSVSK